ncbi:GNAT family N-acetyltransferase [Paractinoplanes deccanensis]
MERTPAATVTLRPARLEDLGVLFEQQREPEANRRANFPARGREAFFTHWTERILGDDTVRVRTIAVDGFISGYVVAWWQDGRRTVGYWLGQDFWGRGIGTRALRSFLDVEKTRPLYADTDVGNVASRRLLERCGFELVETVDTGEVRYDLLILR